MISMLTCPRAHSHRLWVLLPGGILAPALAIMDDSAFGCSECGSQRFHTNESQELVCEDCGTLCQVRSRRQS